jgi:hypothetical protein
MLAVGFVAGFAGPAAAAQSGNPFGFLDEVSPGPSGLHIRGWAIDPDTTNPIAVHVYMDGAFVTGTTASANRPDVGAAYPGYGSAHGYDLTVPGAPGQHTICTYGINVGMGTVNTQLGCKTVTQGPNAVISLGDSFMSGEGGRLAGNNVVSGNETYVDRMNGGDPSMAYPGFPSSTWNWTDASGNSHAQGCHRSDVAEINGVSGYVHVNLACSGAFTWNIWRASNTGQWFKGESPQADQLTDKARHFNVKAVFLSIGGNDLGFGSIIDACVKAYSLPLPGTSPACYTKQEQLARNNIGLILNHVQASIDEVRAAMSAAGYQPADYKLIVQDYPNVLADAAHIRNGNRDGCPIYATDADWVSNYLIPRLEGAIQQAAHSRPGVQFMDLRKAFTGHELCNTNTLRASTGPVSMDQAEWVNQLAVNIIDSNKTSESFHPNAYGQQALQKCADMIFQRPDAGDYQCVNAAGSNATNMVLWPLADPILPTTRGPMFHGGTTIPAGSCLTADSGKARLCFQTDGNLVVYDENWGVRWTSNTAWWGASTCVFQTDGNLVLYDQIGTAMWQTNTWGNPGSQLYIQNDGNVVIFNHAATVLWSTGTFH